MTLATRQATTQVPIVFYAGSDPVSAGLVQSFRKPGGRLTGVYSRTLDLTPKRFELLKAILPRLRRVVTFYRRDNAVAVRSVQAMRDVAHELKLELLERPVASSDELRAGLRALKPGTADAYLQAGDATIVSQTDLILEIARAKKLPTIFSDETSVVRGGLACYGPNYRTASRHAAAYVRHVLLGADPGNLPVGQMDEPYTVINLKTAKELELTIPPSLLQRVDRVIERCGLPAQIMYTGLRQASRSVATGARPARLGAVDLPVGSEQRRSQTPAHTRRARDERHG